MSVNEFISFLVTVIITNVMHSLNKMNRYKVLQNRLKKIYSLWSPDTHWEDYQNYRLYVLLSSVSLYPK